MAFVWYCRITYSAPPKSGNKKITIDQKSGTVTVKKGLKKGTYKVKAVVAASGDENYLPSGEKKVTFTIKVK